MENSHQDTAKQPAATNRVPVLFFLSLAILLIVIALLGWSYFSRDAAGPAPAVSASTEITAPIELPSDAEQPADATGGTSEDAASSASTASTAGTAAAESVTEPGSANETAVDGEDEIESRAEAVPTEGDEMPAPAEITAGETSSPTATAAESTTPSTPTNEPASLADENGGAVTESPDESTANTAGESAPADTSPATVAHDSAANEKTGEMARALAAAESPAQPVAEDAGASAGADADARAGADAGAAALALPATPDTPATTQPAAEESEAVAGETVETTSDAASDETAATTSDTSPAETAEAADEATESRDGVAAASPAESAPATGSAGQGPESPANGTTSAEKAKDSATDGAASAEAPEEVAAPDTTSAPAETTSRDEFESTATVQEPASSDKDTGTAIAAPVPAPPIRPSFLADTRPRIAIVISELGVNTAAARRAIELLPAEISFSFNPYGHNLQRLADEARAAGHEVLLQVPMEPVGYPRLDPGAYGLRTDLSREENLKRLDWALRRFSGYVGITNQMGSKFTKDADAIGPVLEVVREKGLIYLDSRTATDSVAADIARNIGVPAAVNNRFLDHRAERAVIDSHFAALESIARRTGSAIGIAYPYEETFSYLVDWAGSLDSKGLRLVPISALVSHQVEQ